jgi:hypothetical protein
MFEFNNKRSVWKRESWWGEANNNESMKREWRGGST